MSPRPAWRVYLAFFTRSRAGSRLTLLPHAAEHADAEHGVDAVDKGHPIGPEELAEALRRVRDHSLVLDGSTVAETAFWVADRYWMRRWNNALDEAAPGQWDKVIGPHVYRRMALHEWMAPGNYDHGIPGL
ncbi:hypothetical protein ACWY4P_46065 [Streptomyces sp. LZ34]